MGNIKKLRNEVWLYGKYEKKSWERRVEKGGIVVRNIRRVEKGGIVVWDI